MAYILINEEAETKIKQALILLENNDNLTCSNTDLKKRRINRTAAIAILLDVIDMTLKEFGEFYDNSED